jgi:hypothetical protein
VRLTVPLGEAVPSRLLPGADARRVRA